MGAGGRMLPMFLVSGPAPEWPFRVIGPAGSLGLLLLAGGLRWRIDHVVWLGAVVGLLAAGLFAGVVASWFPRRLVRVLEPEFGHVAAGFLSRLLGLGAGVAQLATPGVSLRGWTIYAELILLGWLVLFSTGIWYRFLGFLVWPHFSRGIEGTAVSTAADLVHRPAAWAALGLMATGVLVLVSGTGAGSVAAARAGAVGIWAGSLLIAGHYVRMYAVATGWQAGSPRGRA